MMKTIIGTLIGMVMKVIILYSVSYMYLMALLVRYDTCFIASLPRR